MLPSQPGLHTVLLFMPAGRLRAIFTDPRLGVLPDPIEVAEDFDVAATAFVPVQRLQVSALSQRQASGWRKHIA